MTRRIEVLNQMRITSQLVFPTFGLSGVVIADNPQKQFEFWLGDGDVDRAALGREVIDAANDWGIRQGSDDPERIRVAAIVPTDRLDAMIERSRVLIDQGARPLWTSASTPLGGRSADPEVDEFWAYAAANDVPVLFDIGTELSFLDRAWREGTSLVTRHHSLEAPELDEHAMSVVHYAVENFLTIMIVGGGVRTAPGAAGRRHGVHRAWVCPLARRLYMMVDAMHGGHCLSLRPSDYLRRNVRVSPSLFKPVEEYLHVSRPGRCLRLRLRLRARRRRPELEASASTTRSRLSGTTRSSTNPSVAQRRPPASDQGTVTRRHGIAFESKRS